jgi:5-formyltetrahydrofolate cyclo-ligase
VIWAAVVWSVRGGSRTAAHLLACAPGLWASCGVDEKQRVRARIWRAIDTAEEVRRAPGAEGRIPNYVGAEAAALRLVEQPEWQAARVVKLNPDSPQLALRARAIDEGKLVYIAVPKLTADAPFLALTRDRLAAAGQQVSGLDAASIEGARRYGVPTQLVDMQPVDLIVCGSVAVSPLGARIGKGGGYADLEFALLTELQLVSERTTIATTVHDLQVVLEGELPETGHDFRVDLIATPTRILRCPRARRPTGLVWEDLTPAQIAAIPVLRSRVPRG